MRGTVSQSAIVPVTFQRQTILGCSRANVAAVRPRQPGAHWHLPRRFCLGPVAHLQVKNHQAKPSRTALDVNSQIRRVPNEVTGVADYRRPADAEQGMIAQILMCVTCGA